MNPIIDRRRLLRACAVAVAAIAATAAVVTYAATATTAVVTPFPDTGILQKWNKPIPTLALKDLQGTARSLKEWRGKVLVVHFWATWCEPCVAEMPTLMRLKDELRNEPFEVVTVNLGEADTRIQNFYSKLGLDFVTLLDRDGDAKKKWKVGGVPMSFVLGADGRARYRYFGEIDWTSADVLAKFSTLTSEARRTKRPEARRDAAPRNAG